MRQVERFIVKAISGAYTAATEDSGTYTEQDNHRYSYEQNNKGER